MRVKTFEAVDMKQALRLVKDELGPRAVIVSSRSVPRDGGLFGMLGRRMLEVTAAVEDSKEDAPVAVQGARTPEVPTSRARSTGVYHDIWVVKQAVDPLLDEMRQIREKVSALDERVSSDPLEARSELSQIRTLLASLVGSGSVAPDAQGAVAQRLFYFLLSRGIDESLSRSLVQRIVARVDPAALGDLERLKLNLAAEMRSELTRAQRGTPPSRIQLFVGPTGVGKTTTIAKLAARAVRSDPDGVLIVTTDVHRVAAIEQMMRFGEMISVPVQVAISPEDLSRIIQKNDRFGMILIDTPGKNHREPAALKHLHTLIEAAGEAEVMLVLAATTRAVDSREILEAYSALSCSRLVLTKLDETRILGELYNAVVHSGRPIACVTTGQAVPEQLESIDVPGILRKVLHG